MDQPYKYMTAVDDPSSFIKSYLHEKPSGLRHLLREMQSRKRINAGASVQPTTDKTNMMRDVSPSAYARVIGR